MKIALVVADGVDRTSEHRVIPVLRALVQRLARLHDVHVFALHQEALPGHWELHGAQIHNIGDGWTRLRAISAVRAEHRRAPFDVVQAFCSGQCGTVAVAAARVLRLPCVVHIGGGELTALHQIGYGGRQNWRGRLREALILRGASAVTAASAPTITTLATLGVAGRRVALGVDLQAWPPVAPRRRSTQPARLLHVASLNRVKDQATLLRAVATLADARVEFEMDIVGEDTLQGEVQRLAAALGLEPQVRFLGFKTHRELHPIMVSADLLLMSSLHEGGEMVTLEAAVVGVPTVGTAVGHIAEWAPAAALAVPVEDWAALAAAVRRVLSDEELRLQLAWAAQRRAVLEDADYSARAFEALYTLCGARH